MEELKGLVVIGAKVRPEMAEKVKYLAKKAGVSPSRFLSNLLETVVPDLMVCESLGVFKLAVLMDDLKEELKSWSKFVCEEPGNVGTPA